MSGREYFFEYPNGDQIYITGAIHVSRNWSGTPKADGFEGSEVRFFALDELPNFAGKFDAAALEILKKYLENAVIDWPFIIAAIWRSIAFEPPTDRLNANAFNQIGAEHGAITRIFDKIDAWLGSESDGIKTRGGTERRQASNRRHPESNALKSVISAVYKQWLNGDDEGAIDVGTGRKPTNSK